MKSNKNSNHLQCSILLYNKKKSEKQEMKWKRSR